MVKRFPGVAILRWRWRGLPGPGGSFGPALSFPTADTPGDSVAQAVNDILAALAPRWCGSDNKWL
jgi:hypothetical protein